jgi:hypothetical protein
MSSTTIAENNFVSDCSVYRNQAASEGKLTEFVKAVQDRFLEMFPVKREKGDDKKLYNQRVEHVKLVSFKLSLQLCSQLTYFLGCQTRYILG